MSMSKAMANIGLEGYEETALPEKDAAKLVFYGDNQPHERIMLNVNDNSVYPVRLVSQLRTNFHSVSYFGFHVLRL